MMKIRVARPTNDLSRVLKFYRDGLGLSVLASFNQHEGFDGVMLGDPGAAYHFEFTLQEGHPAPRAPTPEDLIIFYIPDRQLWERRIETLRKHGFSPVAAHNPYWDRGGKTFEDFEGYRVVLFNGEWKL